MAIQILSFVIGINQTEMHKYVMEKYVTPRFGASIGDPLYDARADLNSDGKIDMRDIAMFAADPALTFKTFGITPVPWYQVALPLGISLVAIGAGVIFLRKR